ncbi:hypothetical protein QBC38DRAFT_420671 [Podospora fimiseda]|uniref:Leucine-rich repeat-containing protein n=1 Tax=Podospora fimiseda TaxID=252190 RepID=A0AAN7BLZ8_9PEZI|nr:hypothetical protein QBC38DRAFT_420671 [Podospora fimiseda]
MDEPKRPTGIPRLSRIPVPGQTGPPSKLPIPRSSSLRASPSRESLTPTSIGNGGLRNPKLRSTPSRDQLASPSPSAAQNRKSISQIPGSATRTTRIQPPTLTSNIARSTSLKRQPSQQWISASTVSPDDAVAEEYEGAQGSPDGGLKPPRPSLAERTMDTLSRLPSSPSVKGKAAASFFDIGGARSPSRASSRASRPGSSHHSEASSSHGRPPSSPELSAEVHPPISSFRSNIAAYQNQAPTTQTIPLRTRKSLQSIQAPGFKTPARGLRTSFYASQPSSPAFPPPLPRSPSPVSYAPETTISRFGAKTVVTPALKKRQSVNGLFKKPAAPSVKPATTEAPRKASTASQKSTATSSGGTHPSSSSVMSGSTNLTVDSAENASVQSNRKTSAALREQIAKARAAKRVTPPQEESEQEHQESTNDSYGFEMRHSDPFNQHRDDKSQTKVLHSRLETARTSGRLNIAAMALREIPADVLNMYNLESIGQSGAWAESVDLTRFVAADNELEMIADNVFPDIDPQDFVDDEDFQGNIFAGLETLDLHGNMLVSLPMGLRRLALLTSLNLSLNRLSNNSLEVISQIISLRDLKLGGNLLYGPLDSCFSNLQNLELLDLHGNNISALANNFGNLSRLRVLNISENTFEALPFDVLAKLPLIELNARKNQLKGTLIEESVESLPALQSLDVSSNQLVQLCAPGKSVSMPALGQLCVSMNRLQSLPDVSTWTGLLNMSADENSINAIPEGFTKLTQLKSVDFSSNDIRVIPSEIGLMAGLVSLRLSGNPLREKKFCIINTEEMKTLLAQRLEPAPEHLEPEVEVEVEVAPVRAPAPAPEPTSNTHLAAPANPVDDGDDSRSDMEDFATPPTSAPVSPARSRSPTTSQTTWPVKPGGVLDRSNAESSSLDPVICSKIASKVTEIQLHHNLFTALPESLTFFAETLVAVSLAHNQLVGETYLGEKLHLPALKELNLSHNHITGLGALITHLSAPGLEKLDVSFNRISALPAGTGLKDVFPLLISLNVGNNHLVELEPEQIKGLRVVDASSNDIAHLNPRIGLLAPGLERLEVGGNRFRVPRYNVLERGTEATLRWLRGRVPVAEMAVWKGEGNVEGEEGDEDDLD